MADHLTADEAERWIEPYESSLRHAHPEGLPPEWQARLDEADGPSLTDKLRRWFWVKHFYVLLQEGRAEERQAKEVGAEEAARQLLRREPVRTTLAGREVAVTSRSYNAMAEIAAHDLRLRLLSEQLDEVANRFRAAQQALVGSPRPRADRLRRYMGRLEAVHRRLYTESLKHRRALYAHALTADGGAAREPTEAPDWWRELTPEDDARLLIALFQVGPGRYHALGDPPRRKDRERKAEKAEHFGFMSLLAFWERSQRLPPASLHDTDLAQLMTWVRAAAPPELAEELEG